MALTTVSERREDSASLYDEMYAGKEGLDQNVPILVDPTISESALLETLGDKYTRTILLSVIDEPKSVIDITREQKIPISSAYRKIHWLEKMHMIVARGFVITDNGKKYHLYQSRIRSVHIALGTNAVKISFTSNNGRVYNPSQEQKIPIY